jgi:hypothetical protein
MSSDNSFSAKNVHGLIVMNVHGLNVHGLSVVENVHGTHTQITFGNADVSVVKDENGNLTIKLENK